MLSRRALLTAVTAVALPIAATVIPSATGAPAAPRSIGTNGVSFSASVPSDVQRDEGEPEVSIAPDGSIYTCGPSGFSNIADYAQVSLDGGDQFHIIGEPPRGQISGGEGGGDCGLASGVVKNEEGFYTWAYTGLGPLTNFSTGTTPDQGRTLSVSPISESVPGVDRQWLVFTDDKTVLLNYNELARGFVVQKSVDGGLTYGPAVVVTNQGGRIGPLRSIPSPDGDADKAVAYFPYDTGTEIGIALSRDGGTTWGTCIMGDAEVNPTAGFVIADHDRDGNIYAAYSEKQSGGDTYVFAATADKLANCTEDAFVGNGVKMLVNRDEVQTTVMPWLVASGAPGRIAVAFYGTQSDGDANVGEFDASWFVYTNMSLNALSPNPTWSQTRASTHPTHYDSICLNGLACTTSIPAGDRSLVDYFAMDMNPVDGRLNIVYANTAKQPDEAAGHVSNPIVMTQESGPSLLGHTLKPRRPVLRSTSVDPEEDALAPYSAIGRTPDVQNNPAMDIVSVEVTPETDEDGNKLPEADGGFDVTMKLADLSDEALQAAAVQTKSGSLMYLFRWINGYQPVGVTALWRPAPEGTPSQVGRWTFGFDDYTVGSAQSGQADPTAEKIVMWPGARDLVGEVNADAGEIKIHVPRELLRELHGSVGPNMRPEERPAEKGARFYDAVFYTLANTLPIQEQHSYLYPVDNAPAMDFLLPGSKPPVVVRPVVPPRGQPVPSSAPSVPPVASGGNGLPATGADAVLPLLALAVSGSAAVALRRARAGRTAG